MRIHQEESFKPVKITLDTREEADALWDVVLKHAADHGPQKDLCIKISNWFSNSYR